MGSFLQGLAGGIQQAQENRLHRAQMEHLQAQTEHMKAQAKQVEGFHKLLKTMTEPKPGEPIIQEGPQPTAEQPAVELPGPGAPVQTASAGEGFSPDELQQPTPLYGTLQNAVNDLYAKRSPAFFSEGPRPMSEPQTVPVEGPGAPMQVGMTPEGPSQLDTILSGYSPQARSFISAALQSGDPNTISAIMARVMSPAQTEYKQFDPSKPIYAQAPGEAPQLFAAGSPKTEHVTVGPGQVVVDPTTGKQLFAGPPKEETPKSPLTVSEENRVSMDMYDNRPYVDLTSKEKGKVNARMKKEHDERALIAAQGKADIIKPPTPQEREKLTENASSLQSLSRLGNLYKPEYVGPVRGRAGHLRQAFGGTAGIEPLSQEESQFRAEGSAFRNKIIKAITGSAMSASEQDRILKQIPDENDPPQTWEGKYEATVQNMEQHADLFKEILKETKVDIQKVSKTPHPAIKKPVTTPDEAKAYLEEQKKKLRETMKGGAHAAQP